MAGRSACGPLCQHPSCWQSPVIERERDLPSVYTDQKPTTEKWSEAEAYDSFPVMTVSDVTSSARLSPLPERPLPSYGKRHNANNIFHSCQSCLSSRRRRRQNISFTEFVLQEDTSEDVTQAPPNLNDYKFVPVLLWKPHPPSNKPRKLKSPGLREAEERREEEEEKPLLKRMDLSESLPPTLSNTTCTASTLSQSKQKRIVEPKKPARTVASAIGGRGQNSAGTSVGFMLDKYIVDGLDDVPPNVINQIIQHLQNQDHVRVLEETKNPLPSPPPSLPLPLPLPSLPLKPLESHVPTSLVLNLSTHSLQRSGSPTDIGRREEVFETKYNKKKSKELSYSRALAQRPSEALSCLKAKINGLQNKANNGGVSVGGGAVGGGASVCGANTNDQRTHVPMFPDSVSLPLHDNDDFIKHSKYFSPRLLSKSNVMQQRHHYRRPTLNLSKKTLLPIFFPGYDKLSESQALGGPHGKKGTVARQYSEEVFSRPQTRSRTTASHSHTTSSHTHTIKTHTHTTGTVTPLVATMSHSHAPSSAVSSNRGFVDADLASVSGKLLLLDKEGQIVHEVPQTELSIPTLQLPDNEEEEKVETSDSILYPIEGTVAPPPSAREEDVSPSVSIDKSGTITSVVVESD